MTWVGDHDAPPGPRDTRPSIPARHMRLFHPSGVAYGLEGELYIADSNNEAVRRLDGDRMVTTVAGGNGRGYSGDGAPAIDAQLHLPTDIALDRDGNLFIADRDNHAVRRIDRDGTITTVAGGNDQGFSGDGGPAIDAQLSHPRAICVALDGSICFTDRHNDAVRRVDPDGVIHTIAGGNSSGFGGDGGPATEAQLHHPRGLTVGPDGALYVTDYLNHRVRRIGHDGIITTVVGGNGPGHDGDGGPADQAQLDKPSGVAFGFDGALYITEHQNFCVRRVAPDGTISTIAGGNGRGWGGEDVHGEDAVFNWPSGVTVGLDGAVIVADRNNNVVRHLLPCCDDAQDAAAGALARRVTAARWARARRRGGPTYAFVFGCPRSGTTALAKLLQAHPDVVMGVERYRQLLLDRGEQGELGDFGPAYFEPERFLDFRPEDTGIGHQHHVVHDHYRTAAARLYDGPVPVVGDKVPPNPAVCRELLGRFPRSRFVFVYRDPVRVASSYAMRASRGDDRWPTDAGADRALAAWHTAFAAADVVDEAKPDQLFALRYETFFSGDRAVLDALFEFLGLRVTPELAAAFATATEGWSRRSARPVTLSTDDQRMVALDRDTEVVARYDARVASQATRLSRHV